MGYVAVVYLVDRLRCVCAFQTQGFVTQDSTKAVKAAKAARTMALCAKGRELLRELQRSDWLPPFNVRRGNVWYPERCACLTGPCGIRRKSWCAR
jgi:hypothetical protein